MNTVQRRAVIDLLERRIFHYADGCATGAAIRLIARELVDDPDTLAPVLAALGRMGQYIDDMDDEFEHVEAAFTGLDPIWFGKSV